MTYTVINHQGDVQTERANLREAAQTILWHDNHDYEIRRDENGFVLWHTIRGGGGNVPLTATRIYSVETDKSKAEVEIFEKVLRHADWFGNQQAMTDAEYAQLLKDAAE